MTDVNKSTPAESFEASSMESATVVNYSKIQIRYYGDHIMLIGNGNTLLDNDINGESNEYVESIVDWEWLA